MRLGVKERLHVAVVWIRRGQAVIVGAAVRCHVVSVGGQVRRAVIGRVLVRYGRGAVHQTRIGRVRVGRVVEGHGGGGGGGSGRRDRVRVSRVVTLDFEHGLMGRGGGRRQTGVKFVRGRGRRERGRRGRVDRVVAGGGLRAVRGGRVAARARRGHALAERVLRVLQGEFAGHFSFEAVDVAQAKVVAQFVNLKICFIFFFRTSLK